MPDQSIASGPDSPRVPKPPVLVGCCTQVSHVELKETVRTWLEYSANWPEALPGWLNALTADDQRRLGAFIATRQPWPETSLLWWNCPDCNTTLAVCGACRDEGMVETGHGPGAHDEQCECGEVVL